MQRNTTLKLTLAGLTLAAGSVLTAGCGLVGGVFGVRSMYEEPSFTVVDTLADGIEVRRYPAQLAAEVQAGDEGETASQNDAFRILFAYITGANQPQEEVAMTVPVEMREPEEIAMTVPVEMAEPEVGGMNMRFFLPSELTLETAPEPTDPRVRLVEVLPRTLVVLRWRGGMSEDAFRERREQLLTALESSSWEAAGEASALVYDPPFALPALRRSEVAVPVVPREEEGAAQL